MDNGHCKAQPSGSTRLILVASLAESLINFRGAFIAALQVRGVEVHVAAPDVGGEVLNRLKSLGVHVHEIPLSRTGMNFLSDMKACLLLFLLMREVRPDFFLGYTIKPVVYGALSAWLARVPHRFALITGLGYAFQGNGARRTLRALVQRLYGLALARVEKVFFQNPDDRDLFLQLGIIRPSTRTVLVNGSGVDLEHFPVCPFPGGGVRFLLIARLLGDKGVREFCAAARRVKRSYPNERFILVGWIDESPDSISEAELVELQADGAIEFLGRLSDVRPVIAESSVYVLPSYREGTPRTVLEAMAMGRPVITTDAPGCRETVVDGYNGFLIPVKSIDALVTAMIKFIENPSLVATMGKKSRQIAEAKYDVHKVNAVMIDEMGG